MTSQAAANKLADAIADVIRARLRSNLAYLRVPELVTPFPTEELLSSLERSELQALVAVFNSPTSLPDVKHLRLTNEVHTAIAWRDDPQNELPLIIIGDLERNRARGLHNIRILRGSDVRRQLFATSLQLVQKLALPLPLGRLLASLREDSRADLLECADYCAALEVAGDKMADVARSDLWRIGILPDTRPIDIDKARLADNMSLVGQLRSSDAATVQRLLVHLGDSSTYSAVRDYARSPRNHRLQNLEFDEIRSAFRSVTKKTKTPTGGKPSAEGTQSIISLSQDVSFSEDEFLEQLASKGDQGGDSSDDQAISVAGVTIPWESAPVEQFADWLSPAGVEEYAEVAGGTRDSEFAALHTSEEVAHQSIWIRLTEAVEVLQTLEDRASNQAVRGAAAACRTLIDRRAELLPYLSHIPHEGVRLFAASPKLLGIADSLIATWVDLWNALDRLHKGLDPSDREYVAQVGHSLAACDVHVVSSRDNVTAHLLPLHPVVIEPRVAAAKVLRDSKTEVDEDFVELLASSVDPGMPGITVSVGDSKRALSYSGNYKHLPYYQASPRQAEGSDLNRTVQQLIERFINVHPYTQLSLSIALVGPSPRLAKVIVKWLGGGRSERVRIDLFVSSRDLEEMQETADSAIEELAGTELDAERFALVVHEDDNISSVARRLTGGGIKPHLIIAFDLSEISPGKFSSNLSMPLQGSVITQWAFNVNPMNSRPVIRPLSGSGRLVKMAEVQQDLTGLGPPTQERSPLLSEPVTAALTELGGLATWVALCEGASPVAAPSSIGQLRLLGRSIAGSHVSYVYSSNSRMLLEPVLRYLQQSTWIHPEKSDLQDFLLKTVRMALPEGLLGFFKTRGSLSNESVLGRLGLAAVLAYLQADATEDHSLVVSLDTDSARQWLNLREGRERRADLLTFSWTADGVVVTAVEVKSRTEAPVWSEGSQPESVTEALDQVKEMALVLEKIFGVSKSDSLTPSRREILKRQVFLEALQQWDSLRVSDKREYERRVRELNSLFNSPGGVQVRSRIFVVVTNGATDDIERPAADGHTPVVTLGVRWLKKALQARAGGHYELDSALLDEFEGLLDADEVATEPSGGRDLIEPPSDQSQAPPVQQSALRAEDHQSESEKPRHDLTNSGSAASPSGRDSSDVDLADLAGRVREALLARNAPLRSIDVELATIGPSVIQIPFALSKGARLANLQSQEGDIGRDLGVVSVRISNWTGGAGYASIELPRLRREIGNVATLALPTPRPGSIEIVLGAKLDFEPYAIPLDQLPHLLVAGTTGSGKSVFLRSILWQLTHLYSPDQLDLVVVDAKGMADYIDFRKAPHIKSVTDFHSGVDGALELLTDIVDVRLPERRDIFRKYAYEAIERDQPVQIANVPELIADATERGVHPPIRPLVVFIDEFAELVMATSDRKRFDSLITRFNQLARAIGGHLIAATQRPSTDVVSGVMKSNFARLALRVQSSVDSRVILDENGAEALLGKGDLLFRSPSDGLVRLQGYNAPGPYKFS